MTFFTANYFLKEYQQKMKFKEDAEKKSGKVNEIQLEKVT